MSNNIDLSSTQKTSSGVTSLSGVSQGAPVVSLKSASERIITTLIVIGLGLYFSFISYYAALFFLNTMSLWTIVYFAIPICCFGIALWLAAKPVRVKGEYYLIVGLLVVLFFWPTVWTRIFSIPQSIKQHAEASAITITNLSDNVLISGKGNPTGIQVSFDVVTSEDKVLSANPFDGTYIIRANAITPDEKRLAKGGISEYELANYSESTIQKITPDLENGITLKAGVKYHFTVGLRPGWLYEPGTCYSDTREEDRLNAYTPTQFRVRVSLFYKEKEIASKNKYNVKDFYNSAPKEGVRSCIARDRAEWTEIGLSSSDYKNDYLHTKYPWSLGAWQYPAPDNTKDVNFFASIPQKSDGNNTEKAMRISYGPKVVEALNDVAIERPTTLGGLPATLYVYTSTSGDKRLLVRLNQTYKGNEFNFVLEKMQYVPEYSSLLANIQLGSNKQEETKFFLSPTNKIVTVTGKVIQNSKFRPNIKESPAYFVTIVTSEGAIVNIAYYDPVARCDNPEQKSMGQKIQEGQQVTATGLFAYPQVVSLCEDSSYYIK